MATNLLDLDNGLLSQVITYLPLLNQVSLTRVSKRFETIVDVAMLSYHSSPIFDVYKSDRMKYRYFNLALRMKNIKHFDIGRISVPRLFNFKILAANCPKIRSFGNETPITLILEYINYLRGQNYDFKGEHIIVDAYDIKGVMRNMKHFPPEIVFKVYLEYGDHSWIDQDRIVDVTCDKPHRSWSYTSTTHLECRHMMNGLSPDLDKISKTINLVVLKLYLNMSNLTYGQVFHHIQPMKKLKELTFITSQNNLIINEQDMIAMKRFLDQNNLILEDLSMNSIMFSGNIRLILNTIFQTRTKFKSFSIGPYTLKLKTFELQDQSNSSKIIHMNNISRLIPHLKNFRRLSFPKHFSSGLTQNEQLAWNLLVDNNRHLVIHQKIE